MMKPIFFLFFAARLRHSLFLFLVLTCQNISAQGKGVGRDDMSYYLVDSRGNKLSVAYEYIQFGNENDRFIAYKEGKFGYLNSSGKEVIPFEYEVAYPFDGMFALVGKSGKYYYITKTNQRIDSLSHPEAPMVYDKRYLVIRNNGYKVFYEDGTELLRSTNKLILARETGIVEWDNKKNTAIQYVSDRGEKMLSQIQVISSQDEPLITHQGYAVFMLTEQDKQQYVIYDKTGMRLISIPVEGSDPKMVTLVWGEFVKVPKIDEKPELIYTALGREAHFAMNDLWMKGQQVKSAHNFHLCNLYAADKMVKLYPLDKWCVFDGRTVAGNFLFDEVLPGDVRQTPVRMGEKWFIYDWRNDSLTPLPFARIHPVGMHNGRLFVSSEKHGSFNEQIWALAHYTGQTFTAEKYEVQLLQEMGSDFDHGMRYNWGSDLIEVVSDGRRILLDYKGREVWTDPPGEQMNIEDLFKIDFSFKYGVFSDVGTWRNTPKNRASVTIYPKDSGIAVLLNNPTGKPLSVSLQDGYIDAVLEMKTEEGKWIAIGYRPPSDCGNSYFNGKIPGRNKTSAFIKLPKGDKPIIVRVVIRQPDETAPYISNEITVFSVAALSWVRNYCGGYGCAN